MHYIRFLKPPRLVPGKGLSLVSKITITTDLGEAFLFYDIPIIAELELEDGLKVGKGVEFLWNGRDGMRSLELKMPLPASFGRTGKKLSLLVRPKNNVNAVETFSQALGGQHDLESDDQGGVVAVRSMAIETNTSKDPPKPLVNMAGRVFTTGDKKIEIWEETGESIARHIWDAGLMLSAYLAKYSLPNNTLPPLPALQAVLAHPRPRILELGAGCGIVGITLAHLLPPTAHIHLTDLPAATDILTHNLSLLAAPPTQQVLDWAAPLPPGVYGTQWDLVVVADCTYNPDVVPDLVATLGRVASGNAGVLVCVAMKVRHESEAVFFEIMEGDGWRVVERGVLGLGVLGGEGEEIEIYVFGRGQGS